MSKEDEEGFEERDMVANDDGRGLTRSTRSFHRNVVVSKDEEQERADTKPSGPKGGSAERRKGLEERIFDTEEGELYGDVGGNDEEEEEEHAEDEQWEGQRDDEDEAEKRQGAGGVEEGRAGVGEWVDLRVLADGWGPGQERFPSPIQCLLPLVQ